MANRVLRDTTLSYPINNLCWEAEVFFYRLCMKSDDFGCFHADLEILKSLCFPIQQRDEINNLNISKWLNDLADENLIVLYVCKSKPYLKIHNFGQRLRRMKSKYPEPTLQTIVRGVLTIDDPNPETESETETESESEIALNVSFNDFWDLYDKKVGNRTKLLAKWAKLNDTERLAAMKYIPTYKDATPDKKYRKNPETFLNNKSWNDEIITTNGSKTSHNNNKTGLAHLNEQADRVLSSLVTNTGG